MQSSSKLIEYKFGENVTVSCITNNCDDCGTDWNCGKIISMSAIIIHKLIIFKNIFLASIDKI